MVIMGSITTSDPYKYLEGLSELSLEEFVNGKLRDDAISNIESYYLILEKFFNSKYGENLNYYGIANRLLESDTIDPSLYSQLKDVFKIILNIDKLTDEDIYLNLVRVLETIEEAYEQIELKFAD